MMQAVSHYQAQRGERRQQQGGEQQVVLGDKTGSRKQREAHQTHGLDQPRHGGPEYRLVGYSTRYVDRVDRPAGAVERAEDATQQTERECPGAMQSDCPGLARDTADAGIQHEAA